MDSKSILATSPKRYKFQGFGSFWVSCGASKRARRHGNHCIRNVSCNSAIFNVSSDFGAPVRFALGLMGFQCFCSNLRRQKWSGCTGPHRATPGHIGPHRATPRHTAPHRATPGHTGPHRATPRLTAPHRKATHFNRRLDRNP